MNGVYQIEETQSDRYLRFSFFTCHLDGDRVRAGRIPSLHSAARRLQCRKVVRDDVRSNHDLRVGKEVKTMKARKKEKDRA